jgi:hypothetical protein
LLLAIVRTRVNGIMRDSDITGKFLQCLVRRLSSPRTLHSESCHANTVHLTRKVFWSRESERADGLRVPYNGKQAGFSFRAVSSYVARRRELLFTRLRFLFLFPTTSVVTHRFHFPQVWRLSSLPTYHTRPPRRIYLTHGLPRYCFSLVRFRAVTEPETYH